MKKLEGIKSWSLNIFTLKLKTKISAFFVLVIAFGVQAETYSTTENFKTNNTEKKLQQTEVTGVVLDQNNVPLPGANILEKGTTNGVQTDFDGNFTINLNNSNGILVVSYIGYKSQEISLNGKTQINITLEEDTAKLDEVVVVGYGTQTKKDLTGSVSAVKGEKLVKAPTANLASNLSGKMTGVFVNTATGQPGAEDINFAIRGTSTTGNNAPLVIVDGIVRPFARLDPNDIESVTVLKDAASTAVYGARAANGVLLVTTKRGNSNKPSFNFESSFGYQSQIRQIELMNAGEYARYINEAKNNYGLNPIFTDAEVAQYESGELPSYDWLGATLGNSAPLSKHSISASGGREGIRYFLSYGLLNQEGFYSTANYRQHNLRSNIDVELSNNLDLRLDISGRIEDRSDSSTNLNSIYQGALIGKPYLNPRLDEEVGPGAIATNGLGGSPIGHAERSGTNERLSNIIQSNISLNYKIPGVDGLVASALYSYDLTFNKNKIFKKPFIQYEYNGATDGYDQIIGGPSTISLAESRDLNDQQTLQLSLRYDRLFGKHKIGALALFEQIESSQNSLDAFRDNFISTAIPELFAGGTDLWSNDGVTIETARRGYIGRIEYDYDSRYLFQANMRIDQSFNFPNSGRTGVFPAFSLGWRLSEEAFMDNVDFMDNIKIRGSWGQVGNDRVPAYQFLSLFGFNGGYVADGAFQQGISSSGIANPNITWETATTLDLGLEFDMLDHRLGFEFDYFKKRTEDILRPNTDVVPGSFGASLPDVNYGIVDSWGGEALIRYKQRIGDFNFSVDANASWFKNKAIQLAEAEGVLPSIAQTGRELSLRTGYLSDGLFQTQDEIDNAAIQFSQSIHDGLAPGDIKYKDINGRDGDGNLTGQPDGVINADDRAIIGSSGAPNMLFGLNLFMEYKGFDLTANFQGATDFSRYVYSIPFERDGNSFREFVDSWRPGNEDAKYPRLSSGDASANNSQTSDFWVKEVTYCKLRNLEFGYNFNHISSVLEQLGIENLRVYGSATNILTLSNLGWRDPEGPSGLRPFYPQTKTLTFGVNVGF
ncbi:SusC/RagA family TonB-linked outer membrane protein [Aestuariibaculum sediminum]|uniref:TonB-dependent receptor n=1 Tax=Aestuariibaculum sediminum TaxID=2770637 RepID=A0A8J6Q9L5_9FLAO|nr:TonB-dependent receptor [Aestuariibaculum sediminum]MBD0832587.1 TonB-dependent receptor [Aestuariibaculum sediminum]